MKTLSLVLFVFGLATVGMLVCVMGQPDIFIALPVWIGGLVVDVISTYKFYIKDPNNFVRKENNKALVIFVLKYKTFWTAILMFSTLIELPLMFAAVTFVFLVGVASTIESAVSATMVVFSLVHITAAVINASFEKKAS